MARKYLTSQQSKFVDDDVATIRASIGDSPPGGWWDIVTVLEYLHGNDSTWIARSFVDSVIGRGAQNIDNFYIDDRAWGRAVYSGHRMIGTRAVVAAIKNLRSRRTNGKGKAWKRGVKKAMRKAKQSKGTYQRKTPRLGTRTRRKNSKSTWVRATSQYSKPNDLSWTGAAAGDVVEILQMEPNSNIAGWWLPYVKIGNQVLSSVGERAYKTPQAAKRVAVEGYKITKAAWSRR